MTTKQRMYLRGLAMSIKPVFQIGKEGLNENMLTDILNYLNKHELMKVSILQNSSVSFMEAEEYFDSADIMTVQTIGRIMVLYKPSKNAKEPIKLPNK